MNTLDISQNTLRHNAFYVKIPVNFSKFRNRQ